MWGALTRQVLCVGAACMLGSAPARAQYLAEDVSRPALIDLSPQVYALPDDYVMENNARLDAPGSEGIDVKEPVGLGLIMPSVVDSWSLGTRSWRYISSSGYGMSLGNERSHAPAWSSSVRLAGVGVHRVSEQGSGPTGGWDYAMAVGALDDSPDIVSSGDVLYGPTAYDLSAKYMLNPSVSLASQAQGTSDLFAFGLGGEYGMHEWGSWVLGVSRARRLATHGWRYQLGYKVDVFSHWRFSWVNEQRGEGYSDLSSYHQDASLCGCVRNQWQLSVPMGRWGKLSSTYEQLDRAANEPERTVGLAQRFWYGSHLRVRLEANRNIVTGAYGLGARFSLPLD